MKSSADVGAHRVVPIDVAEIDHLLFEIDCVAGQRLFRRVDFDLAQRARLRLRQRQVRRIGARQFDRAMSRGRRKTAECRPRDSRAYWRSRYWRRSPFGARTAIAPSASRLRRDRSETIGRHFSAGLDRSSASGLARGLPGSVGKQQRPHTARSRVPRRGARPWPNRPAPAPRKECPGFRPPRGAGRS